MLGWEYDQAADMILGIFTDAPKVDDPNPAAFQPALRYVVALAVIASEIHPLDEQPADPAPEPDPA
ncbi:hypothetical protein [Lentzea sp. NEAU-D7]|uniref:hypothetical protein n=1 Tax=Lentzea sp. NEAU-D7 TaxID=2994667 RepID=UPI00224B4337|nr:hypothetical protein [Lentzea sp. NEAU-D7]MCX2949945.1 hypothetical protein [Lentzea sp. NEAU-D7]